MPEREVEWTFSGPWVPLGDDYVVEAEAYVHGVDRATGAPDLEARFEIRDEVPECVEFTLRSKEGGRAVRTSDLRLFEIDGFTVNTYMRIVMRRRRKVGEAAQPLRDERDAWAANAALVDAVRGRRSVSRWELEEVARVYTENVDQQPTRAVELFLGKSARTAARRIKQAEDAGLLPPTTKGKKRRNEP